MKHQEIGSKIWDICFWGGWRKARNETVDGSESRRSPVDVVDIPVFIGLYTSQVVFSPDFFHQQKDSMYFFQKAEVTSKKQGNWMKLDEG